MTLSELNPFLRYAMRHGSHHNRNARSVCYDCRLFYMEGGQGSLIIGNTRHELNENTVVYLPPETIYQFAFRQSADFSFIVIDFDLTQAASHLRESLLTPVESNFDPSIVPIRETPAELSHPIIASLPKLRPTMAQCRDLFFEREMFYREKASALVKLCLLEMIRGERLEARGVELCEGILDYIHRRCPEGELTNIEVAQAFGYHPNYLSTLIRTYTGKTMHQYIVEYRLRIVKNLLLTTSLDAEAIATRAGFCSASHLIKVFRRTTGMTPKAYRAARIRTDL